MKQGRLWFPLDVHFWDDPDVVAMGESAAILFQKLIAYAKVHVTDGVVPMAAVRALGGRRWADKMAAIVAQGVVAVTDERAPNEHHFAASVAAIDGALWCRVVAYLAWNDSSDRIDERREKTAEKKRRQREAMANVPGGQAGSVPRKAGRQESEKRKEESEESANALSAREAPPARTFPLDLTADELAVLKAQAARAEALRVGFLERFTARCPGVKPEPCVRIPESRDPWREVAGQIEDYQVVPLLDAFFADEFCSDFRPSKLRSQRVQLLTTGPRAPKQQGAKRGASTEPMTHDEARAFVEAHAGKGATVHVQKF